MKWKDLISNNFSRKAEIVLIMIAALVYVGTIQADEGKVISSEIVKLAIHGIFFIGLAGIISQTIIDWCWPKNSILTAEST